MDVKILIIIVLIFIIGYQSNRHFIEIYKRLKSFFSVSRKKGNDLIKMPKTFEIKKYIDRCIKKDLSQLVKHESLKALCEYSTEDGKRIRSVILLSLLKRKNPVIEKYGIDSILFIEYLHASSLIMDDIMDHDLMRRNQLCVYKKYGYTMAQLTAMQLMAMSFVKISQMIRNIHNSLATRIDKNELTIWILDNITNNFQDLCFGQFLDLNGHKNQIRSLIEKKTVTLFEISFVLGWVLSGETLSEINSIKKLGNLFGLIFQIADDFEDYDKDNNQNSQNNYVIANGREASYKHFQTYKNDFVNMSDQLGVLTPEIVEIISYLEMKIKQSLQIISS